MLKIRISRKGRSGQWLFWIIVIDSRKKRESGNFLEIVGKYNPHTKWINLNETSIKKWINFGAQPTHTVKNLLQKHLWSKVKKIK